LLKQEVLSRFGDERRPTRDSVEKPANVHPVILILSLAGEESNKLNMS
jgi:hypothetical protein